ncbi:hypothetical protein C1H76_7914 [Elsinoe australis]|uniref:Uncharacterized protein n=1 Tax=Elsinoe australis TaxID=40998 RepID=A0A4U7ATB9_9PEZI|nr:hypothetical protein C1H76_7914 [Elsinoe australis]
MSSVEFTEREAAVMGAVFSIIDIPVISAEQWKEIAGKAGINNGDVGRNAKFAFQNVKKKLGIKCGDGGKGGKVAVKRKKDEAAEVKEDDAAEEETSSPGADEDEMKPATTKKGKGGRKRVKAEDK